MSDKLFTRQVCINQLVRPKIFVPDYIRPKGTGDCTTCKTCLRNVECKAFTPVSIVPCAPPRKEEKENDNNREKHQ